MESIGIPDLYGVGVELTAGLLYLYSSRRDSINACCERWMETVLDGE